MFKRVLVLVLFLLAVFWWLTNRGDDAPTAPKEETATETPVDSENQAASTEEEPSAEEDKTPAVETTTETEATTVVTPPTTNNTANNVVDTPVAPTVTPNPTPVVVAPTLPNRITDIKVFMYEWNVDLSSKTIPSGTINFQVQNDGRFTHDFNISGFGNLAYTLPQNVFTATSICEIASIVLRIASRSASESRTLKS